MYSDYLNASKKHCLCETKFVSEPAYDNRYKPFYRQHNKGYDMRERLDKIDLKIIRLLQKNGRNWISMVSQGHNWS